MKENGRNKFSEELCPTRSESCARLSRVPNPSRVLCGRVGSQSHPYSDLATEQRPSLAEDERLTTALLPFSRL